MSDRRDFFFAQIVSESELDSAFSDLEQADRDLSVDTDLAAITLSSVYGGIMSGGTVTHPSGAPPQADHTQNIAALAGYEEQGRRIKTASSLSVDCSRAGQTPIGAGGTPDGVDVTPSAGNERWVSLYVFFDRATSDPRLDGTGETVDFLSEESFRFFTKAGAEVVAPAPASPDPPLEAGKLLLADIRLSSANTEEINTTRRQDWLVVSGTEFSHNLGTSRGAIEQLFSDLEDHVSGAAGRQDADTIDWAGGSDWRDTGGGGPTTNPATDVESQLDKFITDLIAQTADRSGSHKVGTAAKAGSPLSLSAGNIGNQISAIVDRYNNHIGGVADRHAADEVDNVATGNFKDGTPLPADDLQGTLDTLVGYLAATVSPAGTDRLGGRIYSGTVGVVDTLSLVAEGLHDQLEAVVDALNSRVRRIGDTMTGDLTPQGTPGTADDAGLGSAALPFKALFLAPDSDATNALRITPKSGTQEAALARYIGLTGTTVDASVIAMHAHYQARSLQFRDDFIYRSGIGATFGPEGYWQKTLGGGTIDVTAAATGEGGNGAILIASNGGTTRVSSYAHWDPGGNVSEEQHFMARFKRGTNAAHSGAIGWRHPTVGNRFIDFYFSAGGNWYARVESSTGLTELDLGAGATDTSWHVFEIVVRANDTVSFFIDGVNQATLTRVTPGFEAGSWLEFYVRATDGGVVQNAYLDVVEFYSEPYGT